MMTLDEAIVGIAYELRNGKRHCEECPIKPECHSIEYDDAICYDLDILFTALRDHYKSDERTDSNGIHSRGHDATSL